MAPATTCAIVIRYHLHLGPGFRCCVCCWHGRFPCCSFSCSVDDLVPLVQYTRNHTLIGTTTDPTTGGAASTGSDISGASLCVLSPSCSSCHILVWRCLRLAVPAPCADNSLHSRARLLPPNAAASGQAIVAGLVMTCFVNPARTPAASPSGSGGGGISTGAIVGAVVGIIAVALFGTIPLNAAAPKQPDGSTQRGLDTMPLRAQFLDNRGAVPCATPCSNPACLWTVSALSGHG